MENNNLLKYFISRLNILVSSVSNYISTSFFFSNTLNAFFMLNRQLAAVLGLVMIPSKIVLSNFSTNLHKKYPFLISSKSILFLYDNFLTISENPSSISHSCSYWFNSSKINTYVL